MKKFLSSLCLALPLTLTACGPDTLPDPMDAEQLDAYDVNAEKLPAYACGTALVTWNGTTAYSNGAYTGTGSSCAGVGTYGYQYQCVELVMRHFSKNWGLRWYGNANQLLANAPTAYVDVTYNGGAVGPVPGDMITFNASGSAYGHVALVTAVTSTTVSIIEQNVSSSYQRTLSRSGNNISAGWSGWYTMGWAHAKANGGGGGGTWNCASSSYNGSQYWTCDGGLTSRNKCDASGNPLKETCSYGCFVNSVGKDDLCAVAASGWNCANSAYGGSQWWTCSGGDLYKCNSSGTPIRVDCPISCNVGALGTNDTCN